MDDIVIRDPICVAGPNVYLIVVWAAHWVALSICEIILCCYFSYEPAAKVSRLSLSGSCPLSDLTPEEILVFIGRRGQINPVSTCENIF
jgi:hypothetical protein